MTRYSGPKLPRSVTVLGRRCWIESPSHARACAGGKRSRGIMIGRIRAAAVAVAAVVLVALLMAPGLVTANAQEEAPAAAPAKPKAAPEAAHGPGGYVEFRSIDGFLYG